MRDVLPALAARGLELGVISNSHRSLEAFTEHFELDRYVRTHVSAHPEPLHEAASAASSPRRSRRPAWARTRPLMVGDSLKADVEGALAAGLRAVWLRRSGDVPRGAPAVGARDPAAARAAADHLAASPPPLSACPSRRPSDSLHSSSDA